MATTLKEKLELVGKMVKRIGIPMRLINKSGNSILIFPSILSGYDGIDSYAKLRVDIFFFAEMSEKDMKRWNHTRKSPEWLNGASTDLDESYERLWFHSKDYTPIGVIGEGMGDLNQMTVMWATDWTLAPESIEQYEAYQRRLERNIDVLCNQ